MPYITPQSIPTATICRRLVIPDDIDILAAVNGALYDLTRSYNWEEVTGVTPDDIAEAMAIMWGNYITSEAWCMIGAIAPCITSSVPDNTLLCDGATYDRVDYPKLYAVLASEFIIDADTFNVPDLRGRTVIGTGTGTGLTARAMDDNGGEEDHTLTIAEMPNHAHYYTPAIFDLDFESPGAPDAFAARLGLPTLTDDEGGGGSHNNMQPFVALRYVVVAR